MKNNQKKNTTTQHISLLLYFGISILTFGVGTVFCGYFAVKTGLAWLYVMSIGCLFCFVSLLFYNKIFVNHPAEITEKGVKIGKKLTAWEDIEKLWPETIWTGRGEPHWFACFLIKDEARKKKKPKNAHFDFRIPLDDNSRVLLKQYLPEHLK